MSDNNKTVNDPFAYLERDHKIVAKLLDEMEDTTNRAVKTREQLYAELDEALTLHAKIEEEVVYPVLEEVKSTHDITLESFEEHHVMKILLKELAGMPENSDEWKAKLKVLKENTEHHVEEEEGDMFPKARRALTDEQKERIAVQMQELVDAGKK